MGSTMLLKSFATRMTLEITDVVMQILVMVYWVYKCDATLGGTEDMLVDLGVEKALKAMRKG